MLRSRISFWRATGDRRQLIEALPAIRAWLARCLDQRGADGLVRRDFEFGDWLDPTAPAGRPWEGALGAAAVANAYLARSLRRAAEIEDALGGSGAEWAAAAQQLRLALRPLSDGALRSQGGCAMLLAFDLCDFDERGAVADRLVKHVRAAQWRIQTGFLTTPLLLESLSSSGHAADALRMALGTQSPSWRAQLERGATTWWERWDALNEEGAVGDSTLDGSTEGMISFNHLAMASVTDWLCTRVAGIDVDFTSVPFARFRPLVSTETTSGELRQATPLGGLAVEWCLTSTRDLAARVSVPEGLTLRLELPRTAASVLLVNGCSPDGDAPLEAGDHELLLTRPTVVHVARSTI